MHKAVVFLIHNRILAAVRRVKSYDIGNCFSDEMNGIIEELEQNLITVEIFN